MNKDDLNTLSAGYGASQTLTAALKIAVDIATNGYIADDNRVAIAIQADKDARAQEIADLQQVITEKEATIATLTTSNVDTPNEIPA